MQRSLVDPVFVDTTVLSNFASTDGTVTLQEIVDSFVVVASVRRELERGVDHGHDYLESALARIDAESTVDVVETPAPDGSAIRERLDRGEADALWGALDRDGTLASDDLAARQVAATRGVPVTGSIGLLALGVTRDVLTAETADAWLESWRAKRGYYAPVDSVRDVLE